MASKGPLKSMSVEEKLQAMESLARRYIKGQKYALHSRRENLTLEGRQTLRTLLAALKRVCRRREGTDPCAPGSFWTPSPFAVRDVWRTTATMLATRSRPAASVSYAAVAASA